MQRAAIATLTMNPSLDVWCRVDRVAPTQKVRGEKTRWDPGGGGINVARGIHSVGGAAASLYPAGAHTGAMLKDLLDREGLRYHSVPTQEPTRVSFGIYEETTGKHYHFVLPGPTLAQAEWQSCLDAVAKRAPKADYLVASGSLPRGVPDDFYAQVAQRARESGTRLVLDTSGEPLRAALGTGVYLLRCNQHEFRQLTGEAPDTLDAQKRLTRGLVERGAAEVVVLTLGADGALLATRERFERVRAPTIEPMSPMGAGDSFVALLVYHMACGAAWDDALRYASAAAAAALLTPGTELFRVPDLERLYKEVQVDRI